MKTNFTVFVIAFALYFPMFGKIIPGVRDLPYNFANYSIILVALLIIMKFLFQPRFEKIESSALWLFIFGIYMVINLSLKGLLTGNLQPLSSRATGVLLGTLILLFIYQFRVLEQQDRFFNRLFFLISIIFIVQTVISVYESATGTFLGDYEIAIYVALESRDLFSIAGLSSKDLFGFTIPFTGMLGTHNTFGNMLMYYNLFFLSQFFLQRNKFFLAPLIVVVLAAVGNTTRVTLLVIVLCDLVVLYYYSEMKSMRRGLIFVSVLFPLWGMIKFYDLIGEYLYKTDSLIFRVDLWSYVISSLDVIDNPIALLFGLNAQSLFSIGSAYLGFVLPSFENQFLILVAYTGMIGLALFSYVFFVFVINYSKQMQKEKRIIFLLLSVSIFISSLTLDVNLHYSSYVLIVLLYLFMLRQERASPAVLPN